MILEVAILHIIPGKEISFENNFQKAKKVIQSIKGFHSLSLKKCLESPHQYLLLLEWETLENHTKDFRESKQYEKWKKLLHHYYDPFPKVEHYEDFEKKETPSWYLYILRCSDNTLYTGITRDIERRISEHNGTKKGAKYTRARQPVEIVYSQECASHSKALKEEIRIKKLSKKKKEAIVKNFKIKSSGIISSSS